MKRSSTAKKGYPKENRRMFTIPAKITPPRLGPCYLRERLFQRMDQYRDKPLVWISAPAGSGKTMLVASYLRERKVDYLWYQIDARDLDPATLFYYLGLAAKHHFPRRKALPLLTPEYLQGLPAFVHNYFEVLFRRFRQPFAIVLDNYQELAEEALLHQVINDLAAEVPENGQIILISRGPPPQALGRFQVHQQMPLLGWQDMQLNVDEIRALSSVIKRAALTRVEASALHAATLGWAAGAVLMLNQTRTDAKPIDLDTLSAPETVFDYFAAEILAGLDKTIQDFLIKSAFLAPMNTAMAKALTGNQQAGRILADLVRKNYFTLKHSIQSSQMYQYHPLFRSFLQQQAHALLTPDEMQQLKLQAANMLIENNRHEEAAVLLGSIEAWDGLTELITQQAQTMVQQGRSSSVQKWIHSLPNAIRANAPWVLYWEGICLMAIDLLACRSCLKKAFALFKNRQDPAGFYLAWSAIVETYVYEWGDMNPLDYWIDEIEALLKSYPQFPAPQIEAKVTSAVFCALIYRQPDHPDISLWEERVKEIILNTSDINLQFGLGSQLILYHYWWVGRQEKAKFLVDFFKQVLSKADIAPLYQIIWRWINGTHLWMTNHLQECHEEFSEGLVIAEREGIHYWDFMFLAGLAHTSLCRGAVESAEAYMEKMVFIFGSQRKLDIAHFYYLKACVELHSGNHSIAMEHLNKADDIVKAAGAPFLNFYVKTGKADVLIECKAYDQAENYIEATLQYGQKMNSIYYEYQCAWLKAILNFKQKHDKAGMSYLRKYLSISRASDIRNHTWWRSSVMAPLFTKALEADIEIDHVQRLIREHGIDPPVTRPHVKNWPYPIMVYTLGTFSVRVDNRRLSSERLGQNKPLDLLKAIIASGSRQVSEERLLDVLWPDAEGDAAHVAFTTTLHRLRKLLGHKQAITLKGHRISLDPRFCWTDIDALKSIMARTEKRIGTRKIDADRHQQMVEQIFKLYQGRFMEGDDGVLFLTTRERLHNQVLQILDKTARYMESRKQWREAAHCYERGLTIDLLMEAFYQGLIRCLVKMGRRAEALVVYRRCCSVFNTTLDIPPSAATQALGEQLQD